jgi:hypothetical protein
MITLNYVLFFKNVFVYKVSIETYFLLKYNNR